MPGRLPCLALNSARRANRVLAASFLDGLMGGLLEKPGIRLVESLGNELVSYDRRAEEHLVEHAGAQVLARHPGMMPIHLQHRFAELIFAPSPATV